MKDMNDCDLFSLQVIRMQLNIQEKLYKRYICGELPQTNTFCLYLNNMKDTRKNLLKQFEDLRLDGYKRPHAE